jgi:CHASE3 domain sensor protein
MKARRVTILRKGLLVLALPLIYQALFIGLLLKRQADLDDTQHWAIHSKDVIEKTEYIFRLLINEQSNLRGYLLTGSESFTADMAGDEASLDQQFAELKRMIRDDPQQQSRLDQILVIAGQRRDFQHAIEAKMKAEGRERAQEETRNLRGKEIMDKLRALVEEFRGVEEKLNEARVQKLSEATRLQNWLLVTGLLVNVGIGAMAAVMFSKEIGERIVVLTENTRRITSGEALPPLVPGTDEIRELDEHFHALADNLKTSRLREKVYQEALERRANELTRANRELEQKNQENEMFVYSVSHDLRSPLVNLQGFSRELGLTREDLRALLQKELSESDRKRAITLTDRDMSESIHFIQTAVTRLSSIIDALLRLTRAGRVE